jgi:hypothetical protein
MPAVERALGPERLERLERDQDAYQQFWLGVLEAASRADWTRESVSFLVSNGYGAVRNMRRADRTWRGMKVCSSCGRALSYRASSCPRCGGPVELESRISLYEEVHASGGGADVEAMLDVRAFAGSLLGQAGYVARRWMVERADLYYVNYQKQLAAEMGVSAPRVAQIVKKLKVGFVAWVNRDA